MVTEACISTGLHTMERAEDLAAAMSFDPNPTMPTWEDVGGTGAPEATRDYETWGAPSYMWVMKWKKTN